MHRAHKIRFYPSKEQEVLLKKTIGVARYAYNWGLEQWNKQYQEFKEGKRDTKPTAYTLIKDWAKERPEWAHEVSTRPQQRVFIDLGIAFTNFFKKRASRPVFKKKGGRQSFYCTNDSVFWLPNNLLSLPRIGRVKLAENLRFEGKIMSYTVSTYADEWYVSVQVEMPEAEINAPDSVVGVDVGLENHPAYASDGTRIELPLEKLHKLESKLKRAQKALSRSQINSHNHAKRLIKKQKVQQKIDNIRQDVTHKFTTKVCKSHATVVIEDLDIEDMIKKAKFRSIRRAFNSSLITAVHWQLSYKAKKLIKVPRFFPSSKTCSNCGAIKSELSPSVRVYKCERCGAVLDRDYNAALNLMKLGQVMPE